MKAQWLAPLLAIVTGLAFFVLLWTAVTRGLASVSGWSALATKYPGGPRPLGEVLRGQVLGFGPVRENNVTYAIPAAGGLYLYPNALFGLGRPPMLIPYNRIVYQETRSVFWSRTHELTIDGATSLRVRDRLLRELKSHGVQVPSDALP
jgi:hypothetical protein